jgi:hypothetical protein
MELEESLYWIELLEHSGIVPASRLTPLEKEPGELCAIFVTLIKMARGSAPRQTVESGGG